MPPIAWHLKASFERTGKEHREVHEWIDGNPEKKAERHDITRIFEYGTSIKEQYGDEAVQEYLQHIHDDVKAKFSHFIDDTKKAQEDILRYFGVK